MKSSVQRRLGAGQQGRRERCATVVLVVICIFAAICAGAALAAALLTAD